MGLRDQKGQDMLYIRTDMNEEIATGHVMRCLSIADAARDQGEEITFILADEQAVGLVEQRGYQVIVLHTQWDDMDAELPKLLEVLKTEKIDRLLIDSYQVTKKYLRVLTSQIKTLYIDDRNEFFYPVNGIICYVSYWRKFDHQNRYKKTKLFMGFPYVPLRQIFCRCDKKEIHDKAEELLLLSGGTDPYDMQRNLLKKIDKYGYKKINVICGRYYVGYQDLQKEYRTFANIHIYQAVTNIESYMQTADIAVSAGGTTLYELCACGTPTISYSFVDNQLDNVHQFQKDGMIDYAGDARHDDVAKNVVDYLNVYREDMILRSQRSQRMQECIDGNGALRIVNALKNI